MTSRFRYSLVKRDHPFPMSALRMLRCVRCGKPGHGQWKTCADGNFHVLCGDCDAKLNALILYFVRHPKMKVMMHRYQEKLIGELDAELVQLTATKDFLDHKVKCLEMERVSQETLIKELKIKNLEMTQLLLRNQAFIRRVQIYEEGKPDKHDTMEDIRAALKGLI